LPRRQQKRRKGLPAQYPGPRRARPPFPINLIFNVKAFYLFFIVVMIASLAAVGLGPGFGGGGRSGVPIAEEETPAPMETPTGVQTFPQGPTRAIDAAQPYKATLKTNKGNIEIQLFTDAPEAVNSFAFLAEKGFYDDTIFFYVDRNFVAQAGDPTCGVSGENACTGLGGPGYTLPVEKTREGHQQWAVVAPAITEGQEVHGSQFRILFKPDQRLDGKETVFGKVVAGQEHLESLGNFVPCSVVKTDGCTSDMSSALVIEEVIVQPA